jgi:hypothetical protein
VSQRQGSDLGIHRIRILEKSVDGHACKIIITLAKVNQVKVDHFLFNQVLSRRRQDHLWKESARIYASRRIIDDPPDNLFPDKGFVLIVENGFEIFF